MAGITDSSSEGGVRSRGNVLALLGGAVAAALAGVLGRPERALAGHDGTNILHLGELNIWPGTSTTQLHVNNENHALELRNESTTATGAALVAASSNTDAPHGTIDIHNDGIAGVAISGWSTEPGSNEPGDGVGVQGASGSGRGVGGFAPSGTGVHGQSVTGIGVDGLADSGTGVNGTSQSFVGVFGHSQSGNGVAGECNSPGGVGTSGASTDGIGVHAVSQNGQALRVEGKAVFSTAGSGTVPRGQNAVFVANPAVTASSHISVTLVGNPGTRTLQWVEPSPGSGFTVRLSPAPANQRPATPFTYLVVEAAA
jgi:hypothetical protein